MARAAAEVDMRFKALISGLGLLFLLAPAGCIFSPDDEGGGGGGNGNPPTYPFPNTPDQLVKNFFFPSARIEIANAELFDSGLIEQGIWYLFSKIPFNFSKNLKLPLVILSVRKFFVMLAHPSPSK